jgi:hypothetical protein
MYTKVQKYLYFILVSFFLLFILTSVSAYAQELEPISSPQNAFFGNQVIVDDQIEEDLFVTGNIIKLEQPSEENVFLMGTDIQVNNSVKGDIFVIGDNITIKDDVRANIFAIGNKIQIEGDVDEDIYVVAEIVMIKGDIDDDIYITAEQVYINEGVRVKGNVNIGAGVVKVFDDVRINGNVNINGSNDIEKFKTADMPVDISLITPITSFDFSIVSIALIAIVGEALVGVLLFRYFRRQMDRVQEALPLNKMNIVSNLKNGVLGYALLIVGGFVGVISLIGLPFVFFGIASYIALTYVLKSNIAYAIGGIVSGRFMKKESVFLNLLIGYLVIILTIVILSMIPLVGTFLVALVTIGFYLYGLGAVLGQIKLVLPLTNEKRD